MKKRLLATLLALIFLLALCACTEPDGTSATDPTEEASNPAEDDSDPKEDGSQQSKPTVNPDDPWTPFV